MVFFFFVFARESISNYSILKSCTLYLIHQGNANSHTNLS